MSFDKTKAMRNAERFLSQGKIRAAINEYQRVVENDPRDFSTLNILGDLHAKNFNNQEAVGCFTQVAEHYNNQGFSHKAIAIYNKIFRIEPDSMEVSAKLAQLYHLKGSVSEARKHYTTLAEKYQSQGKKIEALTIWKQIADLDPNNTEIYLKIADTYYQEHQLEDASWAFVEAGLRLNKQEKYETALTAFSRALEIKKDDLRALKGLVAAQLSIGDADEAIIALEKAQEDQPYNRDVLYLLVDCHLEAGNLPEAEAAIFKLIEQEPANYTKFLDLVRLHLKSNNLDAAIRILAHSSEHLLVGGQAEEFLEWANEILARNPERTDAVKLLVQYYNWQRDPSALRESLERLIEVARGNDDVESERYALSQLALTTQIKENTQRLQEINTAQGYAPDSGTEIEDYGQISSLENFAPAAEPTADNSQQFAEYSFSDLQSSYNAESNGHSTNGANYEQSDVQPSGAETFGDGFAMVETNYSESAPLPSQSAPVELNVSGEHRLQKELESIEFYIEQDYQELAAKSLNELEAEFGMQPQIVELRSRLYGFTPPPEIEIEAEMPPPIASKSEPKTNLIPNLESFDDLTSEFDQEETDTADLDDRYETHYHLATAYREMGLTEDAIREFQDAINLVEKSDGTRRFFQCATLLGQCFLDKQMPNLAVIWYQRSLDVADLNDDEKHALFYELGNAFDLSGETKSARQYFEKLYTENVNYRDVGKRLTKLRKKKESE